MKYRWHSIALAIILCLVSSVAEAEENFPYTEAPESVYQLALAIMRYHEEVTGVMYPEGRPDIIFDHSAKGMERAAEYYFIPRSILLDRAFEKCDFDSIRVHLHDLRLLETDECESNKFRTTLSHELGHWLTHTMVLHFRTDSWLEKYFSDKKHISASLNARMLIEGVGEYYGRLFPAEASQPFSEYYGKKRVGPDDFWGELVPKWYTYDGGYDVVRGIFNAKGPKEGLFWILDHTFEGLPDVKKALRYKREGMNIPKKKRP